MEIPREVYDKFLGQFEARVSAFEQALNKWSKTEGEPRPTENYWVEKLVAEGGGDFSIIEPATPLPPEAEELIIPGAPPVVPSGEPILPPPPVEKTKIFKSDMFRKMTDPEYDQYKQIRAAFPERLGAVFDGATSILTTDEFFPMLYAAAVDAYGEDRANELLAPTE